MNEAIALMLVQLVIGVIATFLAILLWTRTRDSAWLLIIIATILNYGRILFEALELFGIVRIEATLPVLTFVISTALENAPMIFISSALIIMIRRRT